MHGQPGVRAVPTTISRRQFTNIAGRYGLSAALLALSAATAPLSPAALARSAARTQGKRSATRPKHKLKLATGYGSNHLKLLHTGIAEFVADLERRSNGAIQVEVLGNGQLCRAEACLREAVRGDVDFATVPTQTASALAPWLNVLDFPYLFRSRGQVYSALYDPASNHVLRAPYRRTHRLEFLFALVDMRDLFLGPAWKTKPAVTSLKGLASAKVRVSNSQLMRITLGLLGMRPTPTDWQHTAAALLSGDLSAMESWTSEAIAYGMTPAIGQVIRMGIQPAIVHTAMRTRSFDTLGSPLQDVLMESAFQAQVKVQKSSEAALAAASRSGIGTAGDARLGKSGIRIVELSNREKSRARRLANARAPAFRQWHRRLNRLAGFPAYDAMRAIAKAYPEHKPASQVPPRRWWQTI